MTDTFARLAAMRRVYAPEGLAESDLAPTPLAQLEGWLEDAVAAELPEPNAIVVSTASPAAVPSSRTVLLKGADARGLVFFTNLRSRKGQEIAANPWVSVLFPWFAMLRQVVVIGRVEQLGRDESAAYFATRPYGSRLGAWASHQSAVIEGRDGLTARYAELAARYPDTGDGGDVPLPPFWGGLLVRPVSVEFWSGRVSRLHDRLRYATPDGEPAPLDDPGAWQVARLSP